MSVQHFLVAALLLSAATWVPGVDGARAEQGETFADKGLSISFQPEAMTATGLKRGGTARLHFEIRDQETGEPVTGLYPAAWVDAARDQRLDKDGCGEKATTYLSGLIGIRPMVDLNSYFVLVMNQDASISVIDPIIGVTGITKLYAQVLLPRPGGDWTQEPDGKTLWVSMPRADSVAIVDLETFKMVGQVQTAADPLRVALQPDARYLWVGHGGDQAGVTVIDVASREVVAEIETGAGHHEIAFTDDGNHALVTNREDGTVSVIDVRTLRKTAELDTGGAPIAVTWSALSERAYVSDGKTGKVLVVDPETGESVRTIRLEPGIGPIRTSPDGRWVVSVNPATNDVSVIDAATGQVQHELTIGGRPYQASFSRSFLYVRTLDSERVSMIPLSSLGGSADPKPLSFAAGSRPPSEVPDLSIADVISEAPGEAAVLVTSPADKTVYYYMEGMNAPMGNFRNYGHQPRAVSVVDRSLREVETGVYEATMKLPVTGGYDIVFMLDSPRMLHCFRMEAEENPDLARDDGPFRIVIDEDVAVTPGKETPVRFRLLDPLDGAPIKGLGDVKIMSFRAPGVDKTLYPARAVNGSYEISFTAREPGAYYLYPSSDTESAAFGQAPFASLLVRPSREEN